MKLVAELKHPLTNPIAPRFVPSALQLRKLIASDKQAISSPSIVAIMLLVGVCLSSCGGMDPVVPQELVSYDASPAFSPDGQTIAYVHQDLTFADTSYPTGIYTIDMQTRRVVRRHTGFARSVDWEFEGRDLVFDTPAGLQSVDTLADTPRVVFSGEAYLPACASHSDTVAFDNLNSVGVVSLSQGQATFPATLADCRDPAWAPDDTKLVLLRGFQGSHGEEICVYDRSSETFTRITNNQYPDRDPAWSPDGTRLAWIAWIPGSGGPWLSISTITGSATQRVTHAERAIDWSPDSKIVAFTRTEGNATRVLTVELATGMVSRLTP